jgi:hypothetical protein
MMSALHYIIMLSCIFIVLASSVKQQYGRHVALLEHIILFFSHPVFALTAVCLAEKQQIPI